MQNYYNVLGVDRSCSQTDIRKAYHKLARKYHPDVTLLEKSNAAYMMASISEAYKVLSDPETRAAYDRENTTNYTKKSSPNTTKQSSKQSSPVNLTTIDEFDLLLIISIITLSIFTIIQYIILTYF